jgi:hypothetical protein
MDSKARALKLVFKRSHTSYQPVTEGNNEHKDRTATDVTSVAQSKPHPQPVTMGTNEHKNQAMADATAVAQANPHPQPVPVENSEHKDPTAANATPVAKPKPHNQPPIARNEPKSTPTTVKDENGDEDVIIVSATPVSRAHSTSTPAQAQVSMSPVLNGDQAKRERKKAILKMRLEQLKIKQELLEMED